jgi:hypothetical protein
MDNTSQTPLPEQAREHGPTLLAGKGTRSHINWAPPILPLPLFASVFFFIIIIIIIIIFFFLLRVANSTFLSSSSLAQHFLSLFVCSFVQLRTFLFPPPMPPTDTCISRRAGA